MIFTGEVLLKVLILILSVCGFFVAKHIYKHKKDGVPLICPIGFDCNAVVHSDYSKFMHIPVEVFGMIYYAVLSVFYLVFIFIPGVLPVFTLGILFLASLGAFLFSIYLMIIQIFVLKKGCSWCITSAVICFCIFILTFFLSSFTISAMF